MEGASISTTFDSIAFMTLLRMTRYYFLEFKAVFCHKYTDPHSLDF